VPELNFTDAELDRLAERAAELNGGRAEAGQP
jgi:hypothetical protein